MKKLKKVVLVVICLIASITMHQELNAVVVNKSTKENVPSSLSSFYNKLTKTYIYNTDKFNCSSSGCISYSSFNRNVGLLSKYEYDLIGRESYLYNANSYFVLNGTVVEEMTPNGINAESEESRIRATVYLKGDTKVVGNGTITDPYQVGKILEIEVINGRSNISAINLNNKDTSEFIITPNADYTLRGATISCTKGATGNINESTGRLKVTGVNESQTCRVRLNEIKYNVKLINLNHVSSSETEKEVAIHNNATFNLTAEAHYAYEKATVACRNAVGSVSTNGILTVSDITGNAECSVSLGLEDHTVIVSSVSNGDLASTESSSKIVTHGESATFNITADQYYKYEGASVICSNGINGSLSSSGVLTVSNVTSNTSCTVSLALVSHSVTTNVTNGSIASGEASTKSVTHGQNATFNITANTYFNYTDPTIACTNGSGSIDTNGVLTVSGLTDDSTCSVTLKYITSTVSFNANGGSGGQTANVTATYNSAMPSIASTAPTRSGYTFNGWYDSASGGTQYYTSAGASARNWDKTSATTLYAQWSVAYRCTEGTLTYNANKGGYICVKDGSWDGACGACNCTFNCTMTTCNISSGGNSGCVSSPMSCSESCDVCCGYWMYCPSGWNDYSGSSSGNLTCYRAATT